MNIDSRYNNMTKIGEGGMAVVYRAHDTKLGRDVAIKVIAPQFAGDAKFRARFMREMKTLAKLQHPNIIQIYDSEADRDAVWFSMPYIDGDNLQQLITRKAVTPEIVQAVGQGVLAALAHAHQRGVIHRDVKPENIFLDREGAVILVDFGIARATEEEGTRMTSTGMTLGTPAYSSPEQLDGLETTAASDQYSFGIVLYEMICGQPPFTGSLPSVIAGHLGREVPQLPRSALTRGGPGIEKVIRRMLEKEAAGRYADCGHVLDAFGECFPVGTGSQRRAGSPATKRDAGRKSGITKSRSGVVAAKPAAGRGTKTGQAGSGELLFADGLVRSTKAGTADGRALDQGGTQKEQKKTGKKVGAVGSGKKSGSGRPGKKRFVIGVVLLAVVAAVGAVVFFFGGQSVENLMVPVKGGEFKFGEVASGTSPGRYVSVSDFMMSKYEITQREYETVMKVNPSRNKSRSHPVENVAWSDAVRYCNERSRLENLTPAYAISGNSVECDYLADGYRLPTEAEWEYAARGGEHRSVSRYSGSDRIDEVARIADGHGAVGQLAPNRLGLYDMSGNVREWCQDGYEENVRVWWCNPVTKDSGRNAVRVVRGGGWNSLEIECAVYSRLHEQGSIDSKGGSIGFRVVRGQPHDRKLIVAVEKSDVKAVRKAIADGARPKYCADEGDMHVLRLAVSATNFEIVKLLLDAGADANFKVPADYYISRSMVVMRFKSIPVLAVAAYTGNLEILKLLIEKGADVNAGNSDGATALIGGIQHEKIVEELLKSGASAEQCGTRSGSPLYNAVIGGNKRIVRMLIDHGADPKDRNNLQNNPVLLYALSDDKIDIARMLIEKGADISVRVRAVGEDREVYLLDHARRNGQYRIVRLLSRYNAPSDESNREGSSGG